MDNQIKKIIVIIPYRGIGDAIFHIPLLRALFLKHKKKIEEIQSATRSKTAKYDDFSYDKTVKALRTEFKDKLDQLMQNLHFFLFT